MNANRIDQHGKSLFLWEPHNERFRSFRLLDSSEQLKESVNWRALIVKAQMISWSSSEQEEYEGAVRIEILLNGTKCRITTILQEKLVNLIKTSMDYFTSSNQQSRLADVVDSHITLSQRERELLKNRIEVAASVMATTATTSITELRTSIQIIELCHS